MWIKGLTDEDFVNYKLPSMYIATPTCSFKCDFEAGTQVCQNSGLDLQPVHNISDDDIVQRYRNNPITKAIVFGGLEPFDSFNDMCTLIRVFRANNVHDDVVIYTGYNYGEIENKVYILHNRFDNIIVKYGRYIPGQKPHYDEVLGVFLASDNQYAERIS